MTRFVRRSWWWGVVLVAGLALVVDPGAAAGEGAAVTGIGSVCVAGLRVDLADWPTDGDRPNAAGGVDTGSCPAGGLEPGLPGTRLLGALTADARGGLLVNAHDALPVVALERTVVALEQRGWRERTAAALARARNPELPLSVVQRADGLLFVIVVARPPAGALVIAAGLRATEVEELR